MNTSQLMFSLDGAATTLPAGYALLVWGPVLLLTAVFALALVVLLRRPRAQARPAVSEVAARLRRQRRTARGMERTPAPPRARRPARKPIPALQPAH